MLNYPPGDLLVSCEFEKYKHNQPQIIKKGIFEIHCKNLVVDTSEQCCQTRGMNVYMVTKQ